MKMIFKLGQWYKNIGGIIVAGIIIMEKQTNAMVVVFANGSGGKWLGSNRPEIIWLIEYQNFYIFSHKIWLYSMHIISNT